MYLGHRADGHPSSAVTTLSIAMSSSPVGLTVGAQRVLGPPERIRELREHAVEVANPPGGSLSGQRWVSVSLPGALVLGSLTVFAETRIAPPALSI